MVAIAVDRDVDRVVEVRRASALEERLSAAEKMFANGSTPVGSELTGAWDQPEMRPPAK